MTWYASHVYTTAAGLPALHSRGFDWQRYRLQSEEAAWVDGARRQVGVVSTTAPT